MLRFLFVADCLKRVCFAAGTAAVGPTGMAAQLFSHPAKSNCSHLATTAHPRDHPVGRTITDRVSIASHNYNAAQGRFVS